MTPETQFPAPALFGPQPVQAALRRLIDVIVAGAALVVAAPLLLLISLAVIFDSPGGALYRARRIGRFGRPFVMFKFRTMVRNAQNIGPAITGSGDPRVTRLGLILRKTKLDELPQFINVLRGDMSLIGPRPEAPELVAFYTPAERQVLDVKPGVSGPVQLEGEESDRIPAGADANEYYREHIMHHKLSLDIAYLQTRSLRSDMKLLLRTVYYIFRSLADR